ncbi:MAG: hypothetical protein HZC40_21310 [Chloroflexi bacterium]|nr:hypothetical protein [Chloroflexota bacterium]
MGRARLAQGIVKLKHPSTPLRSAQDASPLRRDALALVTFAALTLVMTNPLVLHLANVVEDKQDGLLNVWIIAWVGHALVTDPFNLFNANIFYPYPNTLAFSETLLPQGLFALPFNLAFDNTVLGYNLVLIASFFLAAYAMYLFVFDLTRSRDAGIIAGIIFAFNPYNLGNLAQVQLLSFGWMPVAMLFLRRMLKTDSRIQNPEFRICFLFALFFSLQALSSFYYAFLVGFAVALYIIFFFITHHVLRFTFYVSRFTRLAIASAIIVIIVVPFFIPYLHVQREMGFERKVTESEPFSASLKLYAEVSPQNIAYGKLLAPNPPVMLGGYPLDNLFPGIVAVALALIGIAATKNRDKWFYVLLFTFSFTLSLGPRLFIAPNAPTDLTLPYRWLFDAFPLMRALRAPVRFDALVMFALAVLAGLGMWRITNHQLRITNYQLPITLFLVTLEYLAFPAANITPVPVWDQIPEYVRWLGQQSSTTILELPMLGAPLDLTPQYFSTYHWHTTPDGYSGFNPGKRGEIAYEMEAFPNERSLSLLQALGAQFVIVHSDRLPNWNAQRAEINRSIDLQLEQQFGSDYIFRVARLPQTRSLTWQMYLPNPAAPNQAYTLYLLARNRGKRSFAIKPTDQLRMFANWSNGTREQVNAAMPLVTSSVSIIPVRVRAPAQPGDYQLDLQVFGERSEFWNLTGTVSVANGEPARQIIIPARVAPNALLKTHYAAGDTLVFDLLWLPLNKIDAYYSASIRIVDSRGNKIAQQDREPAGRTFLWTPGNAVPDRFTLTLPREILPGEYSIQVLMYQAEQAIDALLLDENFQPHETIDLGQFIVK